MDINADGYKRINSHKGFRFLKKNSTPLGDLLKKINSGTKSIKNSPELKKVVDSMFKEYSLVNSYMDMSVYKELKNLSKDEIIELCKALYEACPKGKEDRPLLNLPPQLICLSGNKDTIEYDQEELFKYKPKHLDKKELIDSAIVLLFSIGYEDKTSHPAPYTTGNNILYNNANNIKIDYTIADNVTLSNKAIDKCKDEIEKFSKFVGFKDNVNFKAKIIKESENQMYRKKVLNWIPGVVNVSTKGDELEMRGYAHELGHHIYETVVKKDSDMNKEFNTIWSYYKKGDKYNKPKFFNETVNYEAAELFDDSNYEKDSEDAVGHIIDGKTEMFASAFQAIGIDYYQHSDNKTPDPKELFFKAALESTDTPKEYKTLGYTMLAFMLGNNLLPEADKSLIAIDKQYVLPEFHKYLGN